MKKFLILLALVSTNTFADESIIDGINRMFPQVPVQSYGSDLVGNPFGMPLLQPHLSDQDYLRPSWEPTPQEQQLQLQREQLEILRKMQQSYEDDRIRNRF
ncbi:hypothetical protein [Neisseria yangbaofengii]|uniref:hypothetical protein n=1 Tax=Neisseria yangbaofengii TaxID=2709396 RepID=UPI0013EC86D3|nr:hypothetical protein [Neisseria yangbaofengii]